MTQRNLFSNTVNLASISEVRRAFVDGSFTPDVMAYLEKFNAATAVAKLPESSDTIILTKEILELHPGKICGIFNALPDHITTVIFNFANMGVWNLDSAANLMTSVPYAKNVTNFRLVGPRDESITDCLAKEFLHFMHRNCKLTIERPGHSVHVNKNYL